MTVEKYADNVIKIMGFDPEQFPQWQKEYLVTILKLPKQERETIWLKTFRNIRAAGKSRLHLYHLLKLQILTNLYTNE